MAKLIKKNHIKGTLTEPLFNVSKVRAMSDAEAEKRAKSDPDAPPISQKDIKRHKVTKK